MLSLVKGRNLGKLKEFLGNVRTRIPPEVLEEALMQDDGMGEYLLHEHYCDTLGFNFERIPLSGFILLEERYRWGMQDICRSGRVDILNYSLLKNPHLLDCYWGNCLKEAAHLEIVCLLLNHLPPKPQEWFFNYDIIEILVKHEDERVDKFIRWVYSGGGYPPLVERVMRAQRMRKVTIGVLCLRNNLPNEVQLLIYEYFKDDF